MKKSLKISKVAKYFLSNQTFFNSSFVFKQGYKLINFLFITLRNLFTSKLSKVTKKL